MRIYIIILLSIFTLTCKAQNKTEYLTKSEIENDLKFLDDLGLSKFEHREKFRKFAKSNGYELKIHFLNISKETRFERVMKRNAEKGATYEFEVTKENFDFMENWFEQPSEKEINGGVVITE